MDISQHRPSSPIEVNIELNRFEIAVLALGTFFLVLQLAVVIWIGARRRCRSHSDGESGCSPPSWQRGWASGSSTVNITDDADESLLDHFRRRGSSILNSVQLEMDSVKRKVAVAGSSPDARPNIVDEEAAVSKGWRYFDVEESDSGRSGKANGQENNQEAPTQTSSGGARRRSSKPKPVRDGEAGWDLEQQRLVDDSSS